jgi:hypothetical protein
MRRIWLTYTALRMLVFIGTAGFFAIFGFNGLALLIVALFASMVVSYLVLRPQRTALVQAQLARAERRAAERATMRAPLDEH